VIITSHRNQLSRSSLGISRVNQAHTIFCSLSVREAHVMANHSSRKSDLTSNHSLILHDLSSRTYFDVQTITSSLFLCHHYHPAQCCQASTRSTIQLTSTMNFTRTSTSRHLCEKIRISNAAPDLPCLNYLGSKVHNQKADPT
jgi:hypothetical protein